MPPKSDSAPQNGQTRTRGMKKGEKTLGHF